MGFRMVKKSKSATTHETDTDLTMANWFQPGQPTNGAPTVYGDQGHPRPRPSLPQARLAPAKIQEFVCSDDAISMEVEDLGEFAAPEVLPTEVEASNARPGATPGAFCLGPHWTMRAAGGSPDLE